MIPDDLAVLVEEVRRRLAAEPGALTPHRVADALRAAGRPVGDATVLAVYEWLRREVVGAGPLEPLLGLPGVTDVLVNGPGPVRIDRGGGLEETTVVLGSEEECLRLAQRLVASGGRRIDDAAPWADVRLPTAPAATRCSRPSPSLARRSRCGCRVGAGSPCPSCTTPARSPTRAATCSARSSPGASPSWSRAAHAR